MGGHLPEAFIQKYQELMGADESVQFFEALQGDYIPGMRCHALKKPSADLSAEQVPWCDLGRYGKISGLDPNFQSGAIYSQEPSAMFVGECVQAQPGEKILDLCAAPGGKTTHIGSYMNQEGLLVANEIDRSRAKVLSENVERAGLFQTVVTQHDPSALAQIFPQYFNKVLVDAPCSGEGMMRKDSFAREQWSEDLIRQCARTQWKVIQSGIQMLAPGGKLIYSTCTFAPEENEQIVTKVLSTYNDLTLVDLPKTGGITDGRPQWADGNPEIRKAARLFPHHLKGEGHFVAAFEHQGQGQSRQLPISDGARLNTIEAALWKEFMSSTLNKDLSGKFIRDQQELYLVPEYFPDLSGLKILRQGVHLGTFKKRRFEPNHALAMAFSETAFQRQLPLDWEGYGKYMEGQTLQTNLPDGWAVVTFQEMVLGWVKVVNGTAKNFFPKGLRFRL